MTKIHVSRRSNNIKTGTIMVTTTSEDTCPDVCPLKGNGCMADNGHLKMHWDKVTSGERDIGWNFAVRMVNDLKPGAVWRMAQAGDLPGTGNHINQSQLWQMAEANKGKHGIAYTHKPMLDYQSDYAADNRDAIREAVAMGWNINLSANNLQHADELADLDIAPVVVVLPKDGGNTVTPAGRRVMQCPATRGERYKHVTCKDCKLCALATVGKQARVIIGFPAHGQKADAASAIAEG